GRVAKERAGAPDEQVAAAFRPELGLGELGRSRGAERRVELSRGLPFGAGARQQQSIVDAGGGDAEVLVEPARERSEERQRERATRGAAAGLGRVHRLYDRS